MTCRLRAVLAVPRRAARVLALLCGLTVPLGAAGVRGANPPGTSPPATAPAPRAAAPTHDGDRAG